MKKQTVLKVPKNLLKPLTEEEKQHLKDLQPMNYVCHHEVPIGLQLDKPSVIRRFINKLFKYLR